jgi:hypothetical protein
VRKHPKLVHSESSFSYKYRKPILVNSVTANAVRSEGTDSNNESLLALPALPIRIQAERLRHYVESRLGFRNQRKLGVFREVQRYIIVERSNSEVALNNAK